MKLIDLSQPVYHASPNCPVHPPVKSEIIADHGTAGWRVELLTLSNHTGSHVDAPYHKLAGGKCLDDIPLERWTGPALIADLRDSRADLEIGPGLLRSRLPAREGALSDRIVLLATGWGDRRAMSDEWKYHAPLLSPEGAAWLVDQRIRGVGIDHYSIGGCQEPRNSRTHEVLLGADIWIVEELRFPPEAFAYSTGGATLMALPINLKGHTGAFCRPVLIVPE